MVLDALGPPGPIGRPEPFRYPPRLQLASTIQAPYRRNCARALQRRLTAGTWRRQAFRFIDSQHAFFPMDARLLLRMLRTDTPSDRRRWFVDTCACRRRPQGMLERIKRGGIATVLNVDDEYHLLVQSATLWRLARELTRRTLGVAGASQL